MLQPLIFYGMEEYFFMQVVSFGFLTRLIMFIVAYKFLIKPHKLKSSNFKKMVYNKRRFKYSITKNF